MSATARPGLISMRAYARSRKNRALPGGSIAAVSKAAEAGRITLIEGQVDPVLADAQWAARTDLLQQKRGKSGGRGQAAPLGAGAAPESGIGAEFNLQRIALTKAQHEKLQLELAQLRGELISARAVHTWVVGLAQRCRVRLTDIPDRLSSLIAAGDPHQLQLEMRAEIDGALREIAAGGTAALLSQERARMVHAATMAVAGSGDYAAELGREFARWILELARESESVARDDVTGLETELRAPGVPTDEGGNG